MTSTPSTAGIKMDASGQLHSRPPYVTVADGRASLDEANAQEGITVGDRQSAAITAHVTFDAKKVF